MTLLARQGWQKLMVSEREWRLLIQDLSWLNWDSGTAVDTVTRHAAHVHNDCQSGDGTPQTTDNTTMYYYII